MTLRRDFNRSTFSAACSFAHDSSAASAEGDAIVMDIPDVLQVCKYAPAASVWVVHLEAVNHGKQSREQIRKALQDEQLTARCFVPEDGAFLF